MGDHIVGVEQNSIPVSAPDFGDPLGYAGKRVDKPPHHDDQNCDVHANMGFAYCLSQLENAGCCGEVELGRLPTLVGPGRIADSAQLIGVAI